MKFTRSIPYWLSDFFSVLWLPILFIAVAGFLLYRINFTLEILGIALGVILGFVSQISVASFNEFRKKHQLKVASHRLLQQDAEIIYRTMWSYDRLLQSDKPPEIAKQVESMLPPRLNLQYWESLKKDLDFLLLAQDTLFAQIFHDFFELEKLNQLIDQGSSGDQRSAQMAIGIYRVAIRDNHHRNLLLHFMSSNDIDDLDRKHEEKAIAKAEKSKQAT